MWEVAGAEFSVWKKAFEFSIRREMALQFEIVVFARHFAKKSMQVFEFAKLYESVSKGLGISVVVEVDAVTIVRRRIVVVSSVCACRDCRSVTLISPLACQADCGTVRSVGSTDSARAVDRQRIVIRIRRL